jgi:hypothetical protein
MIIKNTLKLDKSYSSKSEDTSNSKNTESLIKGLMWVKIVLFSLFLMSSVLALQEALTFEEEGNKTINYFSDAETLFKCEGGFYSSGQTLALKDKELDWIWILMVLLAIGLTILFNLYICPTEVILRLFHGIQFQVKSLTFGLKRSDKKVKSFEMLTKALVKMLEGEFLSKVEKGEIEKINKEEELKRLEKEENNKFSCCFECFLRHKCLFCWCVSRILISLTITTIISITLITIILMSF